MKTIGWPRGAIAAMMLTAVPSALAKPTFVPGDMPEGGQNQSSVLQAMNADDLLDGQVRDLDPTAAPAMKASEIERDSPSLVHATADVPGTGSDCTAARLQGCNTASKTKTIYGAGPSSTKRNGCTTSCTCSGAAAPWCRTTASTGKGSAWGSCYCPAPESASSEPSTSTSCPTPTSRTGSGYSIDEYPCDSDFDVNTLAGCQKLATCLRTSGQKIGGFGGAGVNYDTDGCFTYTDGSYDDRLWFGSGLHSTTDGGWAIASSSRDKQRIRCAGKKNNWDDVAEIVKHGHYCETVVSVPLGAEKSVRECAELCKNDADGYCSYFTLTKESAAKEKGLCKRAYMMQTKESENEKDPYCPGGGHHWKDNVILFNSRSVVDTYLLKRGFKKIPPQCAIISPTAKGKTLFAADPGDYTRIFGEMQKEGPCGIAQCGGPYSPKDGTRKNIFGVALHTRFWDATEATATTKQYAYGCLPSSMASALYRNGVADAEPWCAPTNNYEKIKAYATCVPCPTEFNVKIKDPNGGTTPVDYADGAVKQAVIGAVKQACGLPEPQ